jgi:hypothetical protein
MKPMGIVVVRQVSELSEYSIEPKQVFDFVRENEGKLFKFRDVKNGMMNLENVNHWMPAYIFKLALKVNNMRMRRVT